MIIRDWQRLAWNVLLGPPLAWLVALVALCLMLAIPPIVRGEDASLVMLVLIGFFRSRRRRRMSMIVMIVLLLIG